MNDAKNELLQFLGGLAMLVVGLFLFSQKVVVHSSFFSGFGIGGINMTSGVLILPFIGGIVWMFASGGSFGSKLLTGAGVLIVIFGVIISTTIRLTTITLFEWVLMLILIFGGIGLLAKVLLIGDKDADYGYHGRKNNRVNGSSSYSSSLDIEKELESMKKGK